MSTIGNALSGLTSATYRIGTAAQNIASASAVSSVAAPDAADAVPVDMAEDLIEAKLAEVNYTANAKVLKAALEMDNKILDILA